VTGTSRRRRPPFHPPALREPVREAARSLTERLHPGLLLGAVVLLSGLFHGLALSAVARARPPGPPPPLRMTVTVVEPPAAPAAPPPPKPLAMARQPRRLPPPPQHVPPLPPASAAPPPPTEEAPTISDAPPVVIPGASLSATTAGGTVAVGVGNTLRGRAQKADAGEVRPYRAAEYAESYALTEAPVFLDNVSYEQLRSFYPEEARKLSLAGSVRTRLLIDSDGSVAQVTVLSDAGHGFGAAAAKVAKLYRFKPGRINGRAVATEISMTINFELR
jgi:protein TonB